MERDYRRMPTDEFARCILDSKGQRRAFDEGEVDMMREIVPDLKVRFDGLSMYNASRTYQSRRIVPVLASLDIYKWGDDDYYIVLVDESRAYMCDQAEGVRQCLEDEGRTAKKA